jgi:hypothetical protein
VRSHDGNKHKLLAGARRLRVDMALRVAKRGARNVSAASGPAVHYRFWATLEPDIVLATVKDRQAALARGP